MLVDALALMIAAAAGERRLYWADDVLNAARGPGEAELVVPAGMPVCTKQGADLGERLEWGVWRIAGGRDEYCALDRADAMIGRAGDGGYTLIGLRPPRPELFHSVEWGTQRALDQTLARANESGLRVEA